MFAKYIEQLLSQVVYEKDDNGVIIARIPDKKWYYTQGDTFEEARENIINVIEIFLLDDIKSGKMSVNKPKGFKSEPKLQYA